MATEVIMPQLGESVVEGTVTKWLKSESEQIDEFEPLVEINTDKVDTEVPSPATGTVLKRFVEEGETVKAGTLLAVIGEPGEEIPEAPSGEAARAAPATDGKDGGRPAAEQTQPSAPPQPAAEERTQPSRAAERPKRSATELGFISPVVARIAAEHQVDLMQVEGTGSGGRITKKDVLAHVEQRGEAAPQPAEALLPDTDEKPGAEEAPAAKPQPWDEPASGELFRPTEEVFGKPQATRPTPTAPAAEPAAKRAEPAAMPGTPEARGTTRERPQAAQERPQASELQKLDPVRSRIAEHMVRSKHTSPHVTTVMEADLGRVIAHRNAHKASFERDGANLTFTAYFVAASVEALKEVPIVNSSWTEEGVLLHQQVNIGVAVSLGERGLIVPVVKNAEQLSLLAIARAVNDLSARARQRQLQPEEVQGGTFTITNHGVSGSLLATPIINQPQCAILGVGLLQKRPVVVETRGPTGEVGDTIAVRPMAYLTLTFDHRIIDGAIGDHFLATVVDRLQSWD